MPFETEIASLCAFEMKSLCAGYKYSVYCGSAFVIEGHKGIKKFSSETVSFSVGKGVVTVSGENLTICSLSSHFAVLKGKISGVTFGE